MIYQVLSTPRIVSHTLNKGNPKEKQNPTWNTEIRSLDKMGEVFFLDFTERYHPLPVHGPTRHTSSSNLRENLKVSYVTKISVEVVTKESMVHSTQDVVTPQVVVFTTTKHQEER